MQKSSAKLCTKRDALELKSMAARNEYLLALASSNSLHSHLFSTDLPDLIKVPPRLAPASASPYLPLPLPVLVTVTVLVIAVDKSIPEMILLL